MVIVQKLYLADLAPEVLEILHFLPNIVPLPYNCQM
jgi:hypothetical protein